MTALIVDISICKLPQPEADKVNFHFIAFVNVNGQLYEFGKHRKSSRFPECVLYCGFLNDCLLFKMGE